MDKHPYNMKAGWVVLKKAIKQCIIQLVQRGVLAGIEVCPYFAEIAPAQSCLRIIIEDKNLVIPAIDKIELVNTPVNYCNTKDEECSMRSADMVLVNISYSREKSDGKKVKGLHITIRIVMSTSKDVSNTHQLIYILFNQYPNCQFNFSDKCYYI